MKLLAQFFISSLLAATAFAELITANLSRCDTAFYQKTEHGKHLRKSLIKNGAYIIQGIIPMTSTSTNCSVIKQSGLVSMMSLQFAIEQLKANSNFFAGREFGYQIDDSCNSIPIVMATAIEIVSHFREESVCKVRSCTDKSATAKGITAIVGPYQSFTSIPFASLLGLFKIPMVSPSASSRLLSKKDLYKSFLRIIPSDVIQARTIAELIKRFNWNYIFAIGSDDNYGKLGLSILKGYREEFAFCMVADEYIPYMTEDMVPKAKEIVQEMKNHENAKVVVVFGYNEQIELILREAEKENINRVWLMSDAFQLVHEGQLNLTKKSLTGILKVSPKSRNVEGLQHFVEKEIRLNSHCNTFLKMYLQQQFACKFNATSVYCPNETSKSIAEKMTNQETSLTGNTIDAFNSIATALKSLLTNKCNYTKGSLTCPSAFSVDPKELTEYLFKVNFTNIHGNMFEFDSQGDPAYPYYDIGNVQRVRTRFRMVKVGEWDPLKGLNLEEEHIVWPMWTGNTTPISKCSEDCLEGHYVSARTECCWSCELCLPNSISTQRNSENCTDCPHGYISNFQRTACVQYTYTYLKAEDAVGISIIVVNCLGVLLCFLLMAGYRHFRNTNVFQISLRMAHIEYFTMMQLILSFVYGSILLTKRTDIYCNVTVGGMYLLKTGYAVLILARTRLFLSVIQKCIVLNLGITLQMSHLISMIVLVTIHAALTISCGILDPIELQEQPLKWKSTLALDCTFDYTAMQAATLLVYPHVLLLVATIIAVRERANKHANSQSKFLNFVAIAHCIVSVAFFPTYKYVIGIYRTIVIAFKIDVYAFTYIGCLILPQLYNAYMEKNKVSSPKEDRTTASMAEAPKETQDMPLEDIED